MNRWDSLEYKLDHVIEAGLAAPSMHNTQPWRFVVTSDDTILVTVDESRLLPIGDPEGRGLHLAAGAAIFNMVIAARHLGFEPKLTLRPGGHRRHWVASRSSAVAAHAPCPVIAYAQATRSPGRHWRSRPPSPA